MNSGPGWIHDIFDTKLNFEKSQYTLASLHERQSDKEWDSSETKCFDGASSISGKLLVVAPTGREVSHNGIEVMFRSILIDKVNVDGQFEDVMLKTWTLLEAGSIKEAIEIPFDIDLTQLPQLRDSFDGEHMALRHVIAYRIVRPWYTFSVRGEEAIGIFGALPPERMAAPENTRLIVNDFGGTAEFDHGKSTFTNDDRIVGNVFLSEMVGAEPIGEVSVILGRTEAWRGSHAMDHIVRKATLHSPSMPPLTADAALPIDLDLTQKYEEADGVVGAPQPSLHELVPADPGTQPSSVVKVTYWLRLHLTAPRAVAPEGQKAQEPRSWWNTHPVLVLPGDKRFSGAGQGTVGTSGAA